MPLATVQLTDKEKLVFHFVNKVPFATARIVTDQFPNMGYTSATRFLNSLVRKGYLIRSKSRYHDGFHFQSPIDQKAYGAFQIPFKGDSWHLEELLLYLTQETEKESDFEKYGKVVSAAVYHLVYRALQMEQGQEPDSPSPTEIKSFLRNARKQYTDIVNLIDVIIELPIFDVNSEVLHYFYEVNNEYLVEREKHLFRPFWNQGIASVFGLRDKFHVTMREMKQQFKIKYGESKLIHDDS